MGPSRKTPTTGFLETNLKNWDDTKSSKRENQNRTTALEQSVIKYWDGYESVTLSETSPLVS